MIITVYVFGNRQRMQYIYPKNRMNLFDQAHVYYETSNDCVAFLANYDRKVDANVTFKGNSYFLPAWSVSILADCKNVVFNTAKVTCRTLALS